MIINHNMNALNAHRNMGMNTNAAGKSMEKYIKLNDKDVKLKSRRNKK